MQLIEIVTKEVISTRMESISSMIKEGSPMLLIDNDADVGSEYPLLAIYGGQAGFSKDLTGNLRTFMLVEGFGCLTPGGFCEGDPRLRARIRGEGNLKPIVRIIKDLSKGMKSKIKTESYFGKFNEGSHLVYCADELYVGEVMNSKMREMLKRDYFK